MSRLPPAVVLALVALAAAGLAVLVHGLTAETVTAHERAALEARLQQVLPASAYDNRMYADCTRALDPELLGSPAPQPVYRARRQGRPAGLVLMAVAPDGYSGAIGLMIGVAPDGRLSGVRVTSHQETVGLGDKIDIRRSDWITGFAGKSLTDPAASGWKVKPDGGEFDAFTGATVTPRAVVTAVAKALDYVNRHQDELFAAPNLCQE